MATATAEPSAPEAAGTTAEPPAMVMVPRPAPAKPVHPPIARIAEIARAPERGAKPKSDTVPVSITSPRIVVRPITISIRIPPDPKAPRTPVPKPVTITVIESRPEPRSITIRRILIHSPLDNDRTGCSRRRRPPTHMQGRGQALPSAQRRRRMLRILRTHPRLSIWMAFGGLDRTSLGERVGLSVAAVTYRGCWLLGASAEDRGSKDGQHSIHGRHRSTLRRA